MLLVKDFFASFTNKSIVDATTHTEVILAVSADSRDDVDTLVNAALAAGAAPSRWTMEQDGMYGRSFQDLDGHLWEVIWMDPTVIQAG
jgi:predicted lactoylglutathione lyase